MLFIFLCLALALAEDTVTSFEFRECGALQASSDALQALSDEFSLSLFVRSQQRGANGDVSIIEKWSGLHENRTGFPIAVRMYLASGRIAAMAYDGHHELPMATSWTHVNDGAWHYVAVTREKTTPSSQFGLIRLYVDGRLEGEVSSFLLPPEKTFNTEPFTFGRKHGVVANCWMGEMARIRIWSRVLTLEELTAAQQASISDSLREGLLLQITNELSDSSPQAVPVSHLNLGRVLVKTSPGPLQLSSLPPSSDFEQFPASKKPALTTLEDNLQHYILAEHLRRGLVSGHLFVLDNAQEFLSILPPLGGCPHLQTVGKTARGVEGGCAVATNAGLFNTHSGACHGNLVSDSVVRQLSGSQNTNFGITKDGRFVSGFLTAMDLENSDTFDFDQLIAGMMWLVRNRTNVVREYFHKEDMLRQETGSADDFVRVLAPRLSIGHDEDGRLIILQMDGDERFHEGADLFDMAELMLKYGSVNAVNLDGGSSDVVYFENNIINTPMHNCKDEGLGEWGRCERDVATILCIRNKPRTTVNAHAVRDPAHELGLKLLFFIAFGTLIAVCFALATNSASNSAISDDIEGPRLLPEQELREVPQTDSDHRYSRREFIQKNGVPQAL